MQTAQVAESPRSPCSDRISSLDGPPRAPPARPSPQRVPASRGACGRCWSCILPPSSLPGQARSVATTMAPKARDVSLKSGTDSRRPLADPPRQGSQGSYFVKGRLKRTDTASLSHPGSARGLWAAGTVRGQRSLCRSEQIVLERGSLRRGSPLGLRFCVWDLASTWGGGARTGAGEGPRAGARLQEPPGRFGREVPPATPATAPTQDTPAREQKPCLPKDFFFIFII